MRIALRAPSVALLLAGILMQLASLTILEFWSGVSTNGCAGCPVTPSAPVVSMFWFVVLCILILVAVGGLFNQIFAAVGVATTLSSTVILWGYVAYYIQGSPLWNLNLWALPMDWIGAGMAVVVLVHAILPDAGLGT
jgi:hypothetical protein